MEQLGLITELLEVVVLRVLVTWLQVEVDLDKLVPRQPNLHHPVDLVAMHNHSLLGQAQH
tara:strand:+ start:156 stop:335 length:180 start_codon:yes stop_codon:yes gene_type:complete